MVSDYAIKQHGKAAAALVEHVQAGGATNVVTFRKILQASTGKSARGTAGFWGGEGADSIALVYRDQDSGLVHPWQSAALTKRCYELAAAYKALQEAAPEADFWSEVAAHLEGLAELLRKHFAA